jgi:hypothetical protein
MGLSQKSLYAKLIGNTIRDLYATHEYGLLVAVGPARGQQALGADESQVEGSSLYIVPGMPALDAVDEGKHRSQDHFLLFFERSGQNRQ